MLGAPASRVRDGAGYLARHEAHPETGTNGGPTGDREVWDITATSSTLIDERAVSEQSLLSHGVQVLHQDRTRLVLHTSVQKPVDDADAVGGC